MVLHIGHQLQRCDLVVGRVADVGGNHDRPDVNVADPGLLAACLCRVHLLVFPLRPAGAYRGRFVDAGVERRALTTLRPEQRRAVQRTRWLLRARHAAISGARPIAVVGAGPARRQAISPQHSALHRGERKLRVRAQGHVVVEVHLAAF
eukprot:12746784-Heterocapsa_arctica.AAC.1